MHYILRNCIWISWLYFLVNISESNSVSSWYYITALFIWMFMHWYTIFFFILHLCYHGFLSMWQYNEINSQKSPFICIYRFDYHALSFKCMPNAQAKLRALRKYPRWAVSFSLLLASLKIMFNIYVSLLDLFLSLFLTSLNCALIRPAETAITIDCAVPISLSVIPFSLATPR